MSFYKAVCLICPDKHFIEPGTETHARPRHAGAGYKSDGSQAADAARRDADHAATPIKLGAGMAQQRMLDRALEIIRAGLPSAAMVDLETSDQGAYGFVLQRITDDSGDAVPMEWGTMSPELARLYDQISDQISDLDWNGVVGEGRCGYVTLDVRTGAVVSSS